jgi:hypothetical protein
MRDEKRGASLQHGGKAFAAPVSVFLFAHQDHRRWAPVNVAESPSFASCLARRERRRGAWGSGGVGAEVFTSSGCSLSGAPGVTGLVGGGVGTENDMASSLFRGHSPLV